MAEEDPVQALRLLNALEMRIALAETDAQLQTVLNKFLCPLLLKLGSITPAVRNKTISICQHIITRTRPLTEFQLPVSGLLDQFKKAQQSIIWNFDMIFIKMALERMDESKQAQLLPQLVDGIGKMGETKQGAMMFHLVLRVMPLYKLPERGTPEDERLRETLTMSDADARFLANWFTKVLLLSPAHIDTENPHPGLADNEFKFINNYLKFPEIWRPPDGLNVLTTKLAIGRWFASAIFQDSERFIASVIILADPTMKSMPDIGEAILKNSNFDLEDRQMISDLYALYIGRPTDDAIEPALPHIQIKVLEYLSKSVAATKQAQNIKEIISLTLGADEGEGDDQGHQPRVSLEMQKLRNMLFAFMTWVARMGSTNSLQSVIPMAIRTIKEYIARQGWPSPKASLNSTDQHARGLVYETVGILISKVDRTSPTQRILSADYDTVQWLLTSYCCDGTGHDITVSIDQALAGLLSALAKSINEEYNEENTALLASHQLRLCDLFTLFMLLEEGDKEPENGHVVLRNARYITLRFINRCMPFHNIAARWLNLIALGKSGTGERMEVIEEAQKGLDPYWYATTNALTASPLARMKKLTFPAFRELASYLFYQQDENRSLLLIPYRFTRTSKQSKGAFNAQRGIAHAASLAPAIAFSKNLLLYEAFTEAGIQIEGEADWEKFLNAKLVADEHNREIIRRYLNDRERRGVNKLFLAGALSGLLYTETETNRTFNPGECGRHFIEIASLASNELLSPIAKQTNFAAFENSIYGNDLGVQDIASRAFAILASHPDFDDDERAKVVSQSVAIVKEWNTTKGAGLNRIRGALLVAADIVSRTYLRKNAASLPDGIIKELVGQIFDIVCDARDAELSNVAHQAIGQLGLASAITPEMLPRGTDGAGLKVIEALTSSAKKESESAMLALSCLTTVFGPESDITQDIQKRLSNLHEIRKPEVQFTVGEGLSIIALGWKSQALLTKFDVDAEMPKSQISETAILEMLDKIISGCNVPKPSLRKASAIWLLSLMRYCGQNDVIKTRLLRCQKAFIRLLSDRDELVQETASRGLTLVYDMGTQKMKDDLVKDLVKSFTNERSGPSDVFGGGQVTDDTEIFNPGAIPTGDGKSVTTYKDLVDLASEAGDPSLVYRFMSLASSNAIWSSRVAFGQFGLSNLFSDSAVSGHLNQNPKIYAKLFRYRFDPSPTVQKSMNDIWNVVVKDPNTVINEYFDVMMRDLLDAALDGKDWRGRQAGCLAIADLLQGRQLEQYEEYLDEILDKDFRVMDDIKDSVRDAALKLCAVLTGIVIRMLENGDALYNRRPRKMLAKIVPFMLGDHGMLSRSSEVRDNASKTLTKIIKRSPAKVLLPHIPDLLFHFLNYLTSREGGSFDYLYLNAGNYGVKGNDVDSVRLTHMRRSPLTEIIEVDLLDALNSADQDEVEKVTERLEKVIRESVGLPTKIGASRVIMILCSKPAVFRNQADRFMKLVRKYIMDRNPTVSAAYSVSLGYLTRIASDAQVQATIDFAKSLYFDTDTNEDSSTRRLVAGEIILAMSKHANDQLSRFSTAVLPFVFIAKHDQDDEVRMYFDKVWQEHVSGTRAISSLYFSENVELVRQYLDSPQWAIKHASALAVKDTVDALLGETTDNIIDKDRATILWPALDKAIGGRTWKGKEEVLHAFVRFWHGAEEFWECDEKLRTRVQNIILLEAKRTKSYYRPHGLRALGKFSRDHPEMQALKHAVAIVEKAVEDVTDKDKKDAGDDEKIDAKTEEDTLSAGVECILGCVIPDVDDEILLASAIEVIRKALKHSRKEALLSLYSGLTTLFRDTLDKSKKANQSPITNAARITINTLAQELLFCERTHTGLGFEAIRQKRAEASEAYFNLSIKAEDDKFRNMVESWYTEERSSQVRKALRKSMP